MIYEKALTLFLPMRAMYPWYLFFLPPLLLPPSGIFQK